MTPEQIDRQQAEIILGLSGGEMEHEPWAGHAYWFEGFPEWAGEDFPGFKDWDAFRTVLCVRAPETLDGFTLVRTYRASAEPECWCRGTVTDGNDPDPACEVCEGGGFVYWGEEWIEAVYFDSKAAERAACEALHDHLVDVLNALDEDLTDVDMARYNTLAAWHVDVRTHCDAIEAFKL